MHKYAATLLPEEQHRQHRALAKAALQHYALGPATPVFVHHNAGMVFRVEAPACQQQYLLKLHQRVGSGDNPSAAQLEAGMHWLAAFAHASDVTVQVPVGAPTGQFVAQIMPDDNVEPICCTLQHWIDGALPNGDFTEWQMQQIGVVMAKLHAFSSGYPSSDSLPAERHDRTALLHKVNLLRAGPAGALLARSDVTMLITAQNQIVGRMKELGTSSDVWGPVHGDLHYENLLFFNDDVRPIDFTGLRLAHYMYDVGVTLYHSFHQGPATRHALFAGYQQIIHLPADYHRYAEAFIAYAAIDNLAWNSTIPEQVESALFQRNMRDLIRGFCTPLVEGRTFLFA